MSTTESLEIERKFDVGDVARVPDLAGVGLIAETRADDPFTLRAVYFDTAEQVLLANRITLRRREGGPDAGWHAKLPADSGARREVHAPLGDDASEPVPSALRAVVEAVLRGRPVHPVLILETQRTVTRLLDGDGTQLAELADDEVTAIRPDTASQRAWREWEVELADGIGRSDGEALLDTVSDALERAGAELSGSKSKLARGLGSSLPSATPAATAELPAGSAGAFVIEQAARLTRELVALDPAVRQGGQDAVHRFRTTIRRLRSLLRVYRGVVSPDETAWLDERLKVLGRIAGAYRDLEVTGELLDYYAGSAPEGFVPQETLGRLRASLRESTREATNDLDRALDDAGYFELLDRLEALSVTEPAGEKASDRAKDFVGESLAREAKRTRKRQRMAARQIETLHAARKAVRRLRYALEAARSGGVRSTTGGRKAAHRLQDLLGDVLDTGALAEWAVLSAETARWAGEDTFGYGVLATLAAADRDELLATVPKAAKRL